MKIKFVNPNKQTDTNISVAKEYLKTKYNLEFNYIGKEKNNNGICYSFTNPSISDIKISVYVSETYDAGLINGVVPFYKHKKICDNLIDEIKKNELKTVFQTEFCLSKESMEDCIKMIILVMTNINYKLRIINVTTSEYSPSIDVPLRINTHSELIHFSRLNEYYIRSTLTNVMNSQ